jgi:hypothetical protein
VVTVTVELTGNAPPPGIHFLVFDWIERGSSRAEGMWESRTVISTALRGCGVIELAIGFECWPGRVPGTQSPGDFFRGRLPTIGQP